jgi:hypothetical protein
MGPPGTSSFSFNVPPWSTEYVCGHCGGQPWFECCHVSCSIPANKNVFHTIRKLRRHANYWHVRAVTVVDHPSVVHLSYDIDNVDYTAYIAEVDDIQQLEDTSAVDGSLTFCFGKKGTAQFADWCIAGSVSQATHCLVQQSLLQAPVTLYLDSRAKLPPHSIHLFLHIAFMLLTTGPTNHDALSSILVLLFSLISPDYKE